jgi:DNA-binding MarR family transcriptional regulator
MPTHRPAAGDVLQARTELTKLGELLRRIDIAARLSKEPKVSEAELSILEALHALGGRARHNAIYEQCHVEGAWLSRKLQALMARGLVRRSAADGDKRGARVELTEQGKAAVATHREARARLWRQAWSRLEPGVRGRLAATVRALNGAIEGTFDASLARAPGAARELRRFMSKT